MIVHIAKRIAFVVLGYFAALAAAAGAFPSILLIMSSFYPESQVWQIAGLAPVALFIAPVLLFYSMSIVMILTCIPAAILKLITEIFSLCQLWLHLLISLLLAASAGLLLMPDWFSGMTLDRWLLTLAVALSALIAGLVYWAIAGRMAGFRRDADAVNPRPADATQQQAVRRETARG
ncbi:hypothetical protein [Taklimakanibacter deserti]|uniref:hypothetical protein n=1 Tax=Taklimakanibacter deserti TaxID=2267839 RepID=UPI000E64C0B0